MSHCLNREKLALGMLALLPPAHTAPNPHNPTPPTSHVVITNLKTALTSSASLPLGFIYSPSPTFLFSVPNMDVRACVCCLVLSRSILNSLALHGRPPDSLVLCAAAQPAIPTPSTMWRVCALARHPPSPTCTSTPLSFQLKLLKKSVHHQKKPVFSLYTLVA